VHAVSQPTWKAKNNCFNPVRCRVALRPGPGGCNGMAKLHVKIGHTSEKIPLGREAVWELIDALQKLLKEDEERSL
jgi:hypothetical protein